MKAIKIPQPKADWILEKSECWVYQERGTSYRGEVLLYSAPVPNIIYKDCGCIIGRAKIDDISNEDRAWELSGYEKKTKGCIVKLTDIRRIVPFPFPEMESFEDIDVHYDWLMEYPTHISLEGFVK